jgi:DNA processing protein
MTDLTHLVALSLLPSSNWRLAHERLRAGDTPARAFDGLAAAHGSSDWRARIEARARAALARAEVRGMRAVAWSDPAYPAALAAIIDPPFVLWTRGPLAALDRPAVAMVGSRAASAYGVSVAARLAADLAARGVAVVSGLARGIDSAAHRGALDGGGVTVAVLGSGLDVIYPPEHATLAKAIEENGLLLSELVAGTPPLRPFFPLRNRIISGLSRAVVVIEAGEKSGSLITARCALEQGREVLAVPGNVLGGRYRGAHALLRDGAKIVESVDDILEEMRGDWGLSPSAPPASRAPATRDPILACLIPGEATDLDQIAARTGMPAGRLLSRLFDLELQGSVTRAGGGRYVRS